MSTPPQEHVCVNCGVHASECECGALLPAFLILAPILGVALLIWMILAGLHG